MPHHVSLKPFPGSSAGNAIIQAISHTPLLRDALLSDALDLPALADLRAALVALETSQRRVWDASGLWEAWNDDENPLSNDEVFLDVLWFFVSQRQPDVLRVGVHLDVFCPSCGAGWALETQTFPLCGRVFDDHDMGACLDATLPGAMWTHARGHTLCGDCGSYPAAEFIGGELASMPPILIIRLEGMVEVDTRYVGKFTFPLEDASFGGAPYRLTACICHRGPVEHENIFEHCVVREGDAWVRIRRDGRTELNLDPSTLGHELWGESPLDADGKDFTAPTVLMYERTDVARQGNPLPPPAVAAVKAEDRGTHRMEALRVLGASWRASQVDTPAPPHAPPPPPGSTFAQLMDVLKLRRVCRVIDGDHLVEPFGCTVVMFLNHF